MRWAALVVGTEAEAEAMLQAAWDAEDEGADAQLLRRGAAEKWPVSNQADNALRLVDVQRRAGLFDQALRTLDTLPKDLNDASACIAAFQRSRVISHDTGRYLMSSALRPPARTPHVVHGKRKRGDFWSRLLGSE